MAEAEYGWVYVCVGTLVYVGMLVCVGMLLYMMGGGDE